MEEENMNVNIDKLQLQYMLLLPEDKNINLNGVKWLETRSVIDNGLRSSDTFSLTLVEPGPLHGNTIRAIILANNVEEKNFHKNFPVMVASRHARPTVVLYFANPIIDGMKFYPRALSLISSGSPTTYNSSYGIHLTDSKWDFDFQCKRNEASYQFFLRCNRAGWFSSTVWVYCPGRNGITKRELNKDAFTLISPDNYQNTNLFAIFAEEDLQNEAADICVLSRRKASNSFPAMSPFCHLSSVFRQDSRMLPLQTWNRNSRKDL